MGEYGEVLFVVDEQLLFVGCEGEYFCVVECCWLVVVELVFCWCVGFVEVGVWVECFVVVVGERHELLGGEYCDVVVVWCDCDGVQVVEVCYVFVWFVGECGVVVVFGEVVVVVDGECD